MKLLYKPFGIVFGIIAGILSRKLFTVIWSKIDEEEPPEATTLEASWPKVLGAAAVQASVFAVVRAAVNRAGAKSFQHVTGVWPGEKVPDPKD